MGGGKSGGLAVIASVALFMGAVPAGAAKVPKGPSPKKPCQQARNLVVTGDRHGDFGDVHVVSQVGTQIARAKLKGSDTAALGRGVAGAIGKDFAAQLAAVTAVLNACVAAHVVSAPPVPPTTTTTTQLVPQQASGQSDGVVNVTYPSNRAALLHATYQGDANFVVTGFDSAGQQGALFVNTIGHYDGVRLLDIDSQTTPARLQVQASGPWTITISSGAVAPVAASPGHFEGLGDQVVIVRGKASTAHFKNVGDANFVVNSYGTTRNLLVNEIGNFDGTEIVPSGTLIFEVQSNGAWSVDLS